MTVGSTVLRAPRSPLLSVGRGVGENAENIIFGMWQIDRPDERDIIDKKGTV